MSESKRSVNGAARRVEVHGSRIDATPCPAWCVRVHVPGAPVHYHESRPFAAWEKAPGESRTVTVVRFVGQVAEQVPAAEVVVFKGGAAPVLFTLAELEKAAPVLAGFPGTAQVRRKAAEVLAA